jgi:ribonuclease T2
MDNLIDMMPNMQTILKAFVGALGLSASHNNTPLSTKGTLSTCPRKDLSCQTKFNDQDTCCFNHPGGQILMTQFWDADPAIGPVDSWTVHGLW